MDGTAVFSELADAAKAASTDAERWDVISRAWQVYCESGASTLDWDYEAHDLMATMTGRFDGP